MNKYTRQSGFTLLEVIVAISIFMILVIGFASVLIVGIRSNAIIWEQLSTQNDGRQVLQEVVDDVRRAEVSSIGSYPLASVADNEIIFYANIDTDTARERVRYWLENETLYKGIVEPTGSPLEYVTSTEFVKPLADYVKNISLGVPVFEYYDEYYTGTSSPLSDPINLTDVRVLRIQLDLEKDPTETPVPLHVESVVQIRNLKEN